MRKNMRKFAAALLLSFLTILCLPCEARGQETEDALSEYSFEEIQKALEEGVEGDAFSFRELVGNLMEGGSPFEGTFWENTWNLLFGELELNQKILFQVLLIGTLGAVFTSFASAFGNGGVSQAGFYVSYLMMITVLMAGFYMASEIVAALLENLVLFMQALIPTYFMAVAMTGQAVTSAAYYQFTAVLISVVQWLFLTVGIPAVRVYVALGMAGQLAGEDGLSKMTGLFKDGLGWCLKSMTGAVVGLQVIQGILLPSVDSVQTGTVMKVIRAIPGIGNGAESVSSMVLGTGILIKNGIGAAALVVLIVISAIPVAKLLVLSVSYHISAALMQPISDARMTECISIAASGMGLLFKMVLSAVLLFFLTIAVVSVTTGGIR